MKLPQRARLNVTLHQSIGRLGDRDASGFARLLESRRHVRGIPDGGVVHPQVVADAPHDDDAGVEPLPNAEGDATANELCLIASQCVGDAQSRVHRPSRMVLVGDGRAEQRHDVVTQELVHGALVAVHLGQHQLEGSAHEAVDFLGVEALRQRREARDVHEENRDLLPFALERAA